MQNADDLVTIPVERKLRDRLSSRCSKDMSFNQVIEDLLDMTEDKIPHPNTFDDYFQLERYFYTHGGFVAQHKIRPDSESVKIRLKDAFLYYRLKDNKMIRCNPEETLEI